jgi:transcriptional coactivator HFI1/ADA1
MALPPRERRRLKAVLESGKGLGLGTTPTTEEESTVGLRASMEQYQQASRIKAPQVPASTAAGTKTNWDIEIRKRYTQPLYAETREFPDANTVLARIVPICYEESVPSGTNAECAELVTIAAETFLKNLVHDIFGKVRVNGPRYENGAGTGVLTANYLKKVHKEEAEVKLGRLQRDRDNDLLPVESKEAKARRPLGIGDLKLANKVGPSLWNGMPMIGAQVNHNQFDIDLEEFYAQREREGFGSFASQILGPNAKNGQVAPQTNGHAAEKHVNGGDEMDVAEDEDDIGWEGAGAPDRDMLKNTLADLLAAPA